MFVVVDYDSKVELFPASYEMIEKWGKRGKEQFLKLQISGCNHRVVIAERAKSNAVTSK